MKTGPKNRLTELKALALDAAGLTPIPAPAASPTPTAEAVQAVAAPAPSDEDVVGTLRVVLGSDPLLNPLWTTEQWERDLGSIGAGKTKALSARFGAGWKKLVAEAVVRTKAAAQVPFEKKLEESRAFVQAVDMMLPLGPSEYVQADELPKMVLDQWLAEEAPQAWGKLARTFGPNWVAALPRAWREARREGFRTKADRGRW